MANKKVLDISMGHYIDGGGGKNVEKGLWLKARAMYDLPG